MGWAIPKPKYDEKIKGLVAGTQIDAMYKFKGAKPNLKPGAKARLKTKIDQNLTGKNIIIIPQSSLDKMSAQPGDLLYASHIRWWYGGLRSVHVKAGQPSDSDNKDSMFISPEDASTAHFIDDQIVLIEKII